MPNHVRCWEKNFYHKIGGHNIDLSVADDMELIVRTFLYGKMAKVNKVLYIQHQGESDGKKQQQRENVSKRYNVLIGYFI